MLLRSAAKMSVGCLSRAIGCSFPANNIYSKHSIPCLQHMLFDLFEYIRDISVDIFQSCWHFSWVEPVDRIKYLAKGDNTGFIETRARVF